MQGHAVDAGMFIRSMATRGFLGGLSRTTSEVALLLMPRQAPDLD
jgi:LAO/AO transport system kinase